MNNYLTENHKGQHKEHKVTLCNFVKTFVLLCENLKSNTMHFITV
jgi:hypothetical protein